MTVSYHLAKPNKNERKKNIYRYLLDENQLSMSSGLHEFKNDLPDEHFAVGIVNRCQLKMHRLQLVNQMARIWRAGNSPIEYKEVVSFKMDTAVSYLIQLRILLSSFVANCTT